MQNNKRGLCNNIAKPHRLVAMASVECCRLLACFALFPFHSTRFACLLDLAPVLVDSLPDRSQLDSQLLHVKCTGLACIAVGSYASLATCHRPVADLPLWLPLYCSVGIASPLPPHIPCNTSRNP